MRCDPPSEPSAHGTVSSMPSDGPPAEQQTVCDACRGAHLLPLSTGTRQRNWQWAQQVASCLPPWRSLVAASNTAVTGTFGRLGWDRDGAWGSDVKPGILVATRDIDCHWPRGKGTPLRDLRILDGEPSLENMV